MELRAKPNGEGKGLLRALPFTGRAREFAALRDVLRAGRRGSGSLVFVTGASGAGKSRLVEEVAAEARASGWAHAAGRAYEVESGCPYLVITNAMTALLQRLEAAEVARAANGSESQLARILPGLANGTGAPVGGADPDAKTQMHWHFAQFLLRLSERQPLLLTLENLQWVDAASLELLHFLGHQITAASLVLIATYPTEDESAELQRIVRSLASQGSARQLILPPMDQDDVVALVRRTFDATGAAVDDFAKRLFGQAGGNAFFTEEIMKSMVERGSLRNVSGRWVGWETDASDLSISVGASLRARLDTLSADARRVAGIMSVIGGRVQLPLLQRVDGDSSLVLAEALEELERRGMIVPPATGEAPVYDFAHPIMRRAVYEDLGAARARLYHQLVIQALEGLYGDNVEAHAAELVPHLPHAADLLESARVVRYFAAAGRYSLERHASLDADRFLTAALDALDRNGNGQSRMALPAVLLLLASAKQRLGAHPAAAELLLRARDLARSSIDVAAQAEIERRLGTAAFDAGRHQVSAVHFEAAEDLAMASANSALALRARIGRATALQSLGMLDQGRDLIAEAIPLATLIGDASLLARVHRAMVQLYTWTGPASEAKRHGEVALRNAEACGDLGVAWSVHWALALMAGLAGDGAGLREHQAAAERLASELQSPLLMVRSAELAIEYASAIGRWDEGLDLAERVLPIARALAPKTLFPRLLVWTGIMRIERDEIEIAHGLFAQAWEIAGADTSEPGSIDVYVVVPACIGMATYHMQQGDFVQAVAFADRALAMVDRIGASAWAIHRLLPILCEALIWLREFDRLQELADRLAEESLALDHPLGMAYADAVNALLRRFRDNDARAYTDLLAAAERMAEIPFVYPAARLRLNAAQLLAADGRLDEAGHELRAVHEIFQGMGAVKELRLVRERMRGIGIRPPILTVAPGGPLTGRERELAELVVRRKSNKEIAQSLGISVITVKAHLRSIFVKLGVDSRGALADVVRELGRPPDYRQGQTTNKSTTSH
jgi:DNA-binding CsgD family transcriptional regulator